jgi:hypothetical protein
VSDVKIAWGLGTDGGMRHISEVEKGKACGCICSSINCSSPLIANQGSKKAHYFSHQANTGCGGESALHLVAKQILEESASENLNLILPEVHGVFFCKDMAGEVIERSGVELSSFQLAEAKQEVRLSGELISDVMSQSVKGETLAVEIFVTNAKDELGENKYRSVGIDAIEIDLSMLPWNIDRNELKKSVLQTANRRWLYSKKKKALEKKLELQVYDEINSINQNYLANIFDIAKSLSTNLNIPSFTWPLLKANRTLSNSDKFIVTRKPKVTFFNEVWMPFDYGYRGTAVVEGKTNVDVTLFVTGCDDHIDYSADPALLISYDQNTDIEYFRFRLDWLNIDSWQKKLEKIADCELVTKEKEVVEKTQMVSAFVSRFREADDATRMQIICKKLNLNSPNKPSKYIKCWNASWDVWRTVIWVYKIHGNEGYTIDAGDIADDPWLQSLLGFSTEFEAYESRRKMVGFWLKKLFGLGFVRRIGRTKYEVKNSQLKNFVPWQFIRF